MKKIYALLLLFISYCAFSAPVEPLPADQAFKFSAAARDEQTILARWEMAPDHYLYRDRFHFHIVKPNNGQLAPPLLPEGIKENIYKDNVTIPIPVISPQGKKIILKVTYQGCSKMGYCYPPTTKIVKIDLSKNYLHFTPGIAMDVIEIPTSNKIEELLTGSNLFTLIIGFLGFGILLAFTPCVLPMIPILSAIIVGQKKITTTHSFFLSLAYVLGMAITYAIAGMLVGLVGGSIQTFLQIPWVIILFSLLFILMALSLFGFYNIEPPQFLRRKIAATSEHQKRGTYIGAFVMGILSTLILSPCVTPPLVGVLTYIAHTGNTMLGGIALFTMGIGMGLPLLAIGFSHGKLIPKTGAWMNGVKNAMGIIMLAMAIWILQRIIPGEFLMLMWAALIIGISIYMGALSTAKNRWSTIRKGLGIFMFVYGVLLIVGATTGHYDPLKPLSFTENSSTQQQGLTIKPVKTVAEVNQAIAQANKENKIVLLDFWASWCISCKEMDKTIFSDPLVQKYLKNFVLLRADVTKNDAQDRMLEQNFNVIAPPTLLFFKNGKELKDRRVVGQIGTTFFINHLKKIS